MPTSRWRIGQIREFEQTEGKPLAIYVRPGKG